MLDLYECGGLPPLHSDSVSPVILAWTCTDYIAAVIIVESSYFHLTCM